MTTQRWIGGALAVAASVWVGTVLPQSGSPAPVRLDRDKIAGLNLTAIPPDAYQEILVAGELNMRVASLFEGKELRVCAREGIDLPVSTSHARIVFDVLTQAVSPDEISEVLERLPEDYRELFAGNEDASQRWASTTSSR